MEEGLEQGLKEARDEKLKEGLRQAIKDLCDVLGIEVNIERLEELERLDAAVLSALRDRIKSSKTWG